MIDAATPSRSEILVRSFLIREQQLLTAFRSAMLGCGAGVNEQRRPPAEKNFTDNEIGVTSGLWSLYEGKANA